MTDKEKCPECGDAGFVFDPQTQSGEVCVACSQSGGSQKTCPKCGRPKWDGVTWAKSGQCSVAVSADSHEEVLEAALDCALFQLANEREAHEETRAKVVKLAKIANEQAVSKTVAVKESSPNGRITYDTRAILKSANAQKHLRVSTEYVHEPRSELVNEEAARERAKSQCDYVCSECGSPCVMSDGQAADAQHFADCGCYGKSVNGAEPPMRRFGDAFAEMRAALEWASKEAKGRLPDWWHKILDADAGKGWLSPEEAEQLRAEAQKYQEGFSNAVQEARSQAQEAVTQRHRVNELSAENARLRAEIASVKSEANCAWQRLKNVAVEKDELIADVNIICEHAPAVLNEEFTDERGFGWSVIKMLRWLEREYDTQILRLERELVLCRATNARLRAAFRAGATTKQALAGGAKPTATEFPSLDAYRKVARGEMSIEEYGQLKAEDLAPRSYVLDDNADESEGE